MTMTTPPQAQPRFVRPKPSNVANTLPSGQRRHFLLFVKVLIKCIERSQNYKLKLQAKALVSECIKRNHMGDPHFSPLKESIELRVRALVGPIYWNQAKEYMHSYHARQSQSRLARTQAPKRRPTPPQIVANADLLPPLLQRQERVRQATALLLPLQQQQRRAVASLLH